MLTKMRAPIKAWFGGLVPLLVLLAAAVARGQAPPSPEASPPLPAAEAGAVPEAPSYYAGEGLEPEAPRVTMSPLDTALDSLFGDVYAERRWRPLTLRSFLSEGWDEPWAGAPAGEDGLTPRHGWLGAFDGVFYRLWLTTFGYANHLNTPYHGNRYTGSYSIFLPFSRRFEVLLSVPFVVSNGTLAPGRGYVSEFGDLTISPRFLLSETKATTQIVSLDVRTPTGSTATGNGSMALTPGYQFWTNPGGPWVVRGGSGVFVPLNTAAAPASTAYVGDLAIGRYFTPHDVPIGDLVFYAASNWSIPLDSTSRTGTYVGVGPGTRFHLGHNFFFLHHWEFTLTGPHPDTYTMQTALLKVF